MGRIDRKAATNHLLSLQVHMFQPNSPLLNLPKNLHPTQVIILDGIRHAIEIADFAYQRLTKRLTELAVDKPADADHTQAFIDVWAIVDSIDRFRQILTQQKHFVLSPDPGAPTINEMFQPIRDLRNVADHLAQRIEYIVAKKGTALGSIGWFTCIDGKHFQLGILGPGSANDGRLFPAKMPEHFYPPTDAVVLRAGEYIGEISTAYRNMGHLLGYLEKLLYESFKEVPDDQRMTMRDTVIIAEGVFDTKPKPVEPAG